MTALASKKMLGAVPFEVRKENPCTLCGDLGVVKAKQVVVAAGTLGSNAVLLRSKKHGLSPSDRVGHGFSGNGDMVLGAVVGTKDAAGAETGLEPKSGPSILVGAEFTTREHYHFIEVLDSRPIPQVIFGQGDTKDVQTQMSSALGASCHHPLLFNPRTDKGLHTAYPLGGCNVGTDAATGVCAHTGRPSGFLVCPWQMAPGFPLRWRRIRLSQ